MYFYYKNKVKNALTSLIMVGVLANGGLDIIIPKTSEASTSVEIGGLITSQENTLLQVNPVESQKVVKKIKMVVTAYSSTVEETDSTPFITASGETVRDGIVANNLLAFGTKVRIPALYGEKVFVVEDRMNAKKGKYHIDIWTDNTKEAKEFGAEIAYIEVLGK